ncbi:MAG: hypothetical protein JSU69_03400 [Candidatus Zixiibacteriota bacterium]|nr:MAG: hypothetical protein JSU69_03400 [candidate division Zixibacteria bacterium]
MLRKASFVAFFGVLLFHGNVPAGDLEVRDISFPPDEIKLLVINADLAAGTFLIRSDDADEIFQAEVEYDPRRVEVFAEYEREGSTGYLDIGSDVNWRKNINTDDNRWIAVLSRKYVTELRADLGACETDLELGGIPIVHIDLDIGAAAGRVSFSEPNPEIAERILIDAGAAEFEGENLGNANFERFTFDGGVGSFELDFSGEYSRRCQAKVSIGLGKAKIYIPRGLPVRIDAEDNFLSSVDFKSRGRYEIDDDYFESDDYRESDVGLELEIEVGLGSVDVIWTK